MDEQWEPLESGWHCVHKSAETPADIAARRQKDLEENETLDDVERADKKLLEEEKNYLLLITVPSVAGKLINI